ncbi:hypothetical protein B0H63DRAFT_16089 [Podospora didyma]|uniref:Uncharacterized protein n=1 Tax=Podospora didyma TaxID=330526 RepID=A0AAE0P4X6_9PEZI|nr:hypothetical protein B0H63DRAFT_16089 [Podospora didyma]
MTLAPGFSGFPPFWVRWDIWLRSFSFCFVAAASELTHLLGGFLPWLQLISCHQRVSDTEGVICHFNIQYERTLAGARAKHQRQAAVLHVVHCKCSLAAALFVPTITASLLISFRLGGSCLCMIDAPNSGSRVVPSARDENRSELDPGTGTDCVTPPSTAAPLPPREKAKRH